MNIFLVEDQREPRAAIMHALESRFEASITEAPTMQEGIEMLEACEDVVDVIICDYHGKSALLVKTLLSINTRTPCLIFVDEMPDFKPANSVELVIRKDLPKSFENAVDSLISKGFLSNDKTLDGDFLRVDADAMIKSAPIKVDVFSQIAPNRYTKLFRKGGEFEADALKKYRKDKGLEYFYVHKSGAPEILLKQDEKLTKLESQEPPPSPEEAREATEAAMDVVHASVTKMGFTPEVQSLAKKSVNLSLKVMGKSPRLTQIISRLKQDDGKYITSHSIMLAEIACGISCQVGWSSAPTFLKLSLAAFLHDLPLLDNKLAHFKTMKEVEAAGYFSAQQIQEFKTHPAMAADYARHFQEIPPDVDAILAQHHEQPDGSGFPRGLFHQQISPLAAVFIIAHDLLDFLTEAGSTAASDKFLTARESKYTQGNFKKILKSMKREA